MTFRQRWIAKLRDPETKQTTGILKNGSGAMCCLGVGLVVAGVPHEQPAKGFAFEFEVANNSLDGPVQGMPAEEHWPILGITPHLGSALASCNDACVPFVMIAKFLETGDEQPILAYLRAEDDDEVLSRTSRNAMRGYGALTLEKHNARS